MGLPFLLLLFLVAASCSGKSNLEVPPDNILALQWPPNVCKVNGWTSAACTLNLWTIHGWWPPEGGNENMDLYDYNKIKSNDLKKVWPNLDGENDPFWHYEWDKHGMHATQKLTVKQYFEKGLNYYSGVKGCVDHKPEKAEACFEKLPSVKKCVLKTKGANNIITEAHLYF